METRPHLTSEDIRKASEMLAILAEQLKIPEPTLRVIDGKGAYANPSKNLVQLGVWRDAAGVQSMCLEDTIIHEFSHILDVRRNVGKRGHDDKFFTIVAEVATLWHGSPARYQWQFEYDTGKKFAERRLGVAVQKHEYEVRRETLRREWKKGDRAWWISKKAHGLRVEGVVKYVNTKTLSVMTEHGSWRVPLVMAQHTEEA